MNSTRQKNTQATAPIKVVIVEDATWIRENLAREINGSPGFCCLNNYPQKTRCGEFRMINRTSCSWTLICPA
jgi:hypothetical protein